MYSCTYLWQPDAAVKGKWAAIAGKNMREKQQHFLNN